MVPWKDLELLLKKLPKFGFTLRYSRTSSGSLKMTSGVNWDISAVLRTDIADLIQISTHRSARTTFNLFDWLLISRKRQATQKLDHVFSGLNLFGDVRLIPDYRVTPQHLSWAPDGRTRARFKEFMKQLNFEFWDEFIFQIQRSPYVRGLRPSWVPTIHTYNQPLLYCSIIKQSRATR